MAEGFKGRRALITGGTRGIGAAIARELSERGAEVFVTGRELPPGFPALNFIPIDFSDDTALGAFLSEVNTLSRRGLDILINNAGINKIAPIAEIDSEDWDRIQKVNVRAPFLLSKLVAPQMAQRGYGRILNITSIFGSITKEKRLSYSTSKFALAGLTKTLAVEMAKNNVVVNSLAPGFIDTELTRTILNEVERRQLADAVPAKRLGTPSEIAKVAAFLVSEENTFIVGQDIIADGGFSIT